MNRKKIVITIVVLLFIMNLSAVCFLLVDNMKMRDNQEKQQKQIETFIKKEEDRKKEEEKKLEEEKNKKEKEEKSEEETVSGDVIVTNIDDTVDSFETIVFTGDVKNDTGRDVTEILIWFSVYDLSGNEVGEASTVIDSLGNGEETNFTAVSNVWMYDETTYNNSGQIVPLKFTYKYSVDYQ